MYRELESTIRNVDLKDFTYDCAKKGIGFTPLIKLGPDLNPNEDEGVSIFAKLEHLNPTGSLKDRSANGMVYYYSRLGNGLKGVNVISIATSGNFFESLVYVLKSDRVLDKKILSIVEERTYQENKKYYEQNFGMPVEFQREIGARCPVTEAFRGREVGALMKRNMGSELKLNQHNDVTNSLGQTPLGMEIIVQARNVSHFVSGVGTGGHLYGASYAMRKSNPKIEVMGVMPEDNLEVDETGQYIGHHQIGLRSRSEVGNMILPRLALDACNGIVFDVSDYNAFNYMRKLWRQGIPAGPSAGANLFSCLKLAERLRDVGQAGTIVTTIPDSLEAYAVEGGLFERNYESILGEQFDINEFQGLIDGAIKERELHVSKLRGGDNELVRRVANLLPQIEKA